MKPNLLCGINQINAIKSQKFKLTHTNECMYVCSYVAIKLSWAAVILTKKKIKIKKLQTRISMRIEKVFKKPTGKYVKIL